MAQIAATNQRCGAGPDRAWGITAPSTPAVIPAPGNWRTPRGTRLHPGTRAENRPGGGLDPASSFQTLGQGSSPAARIANALFAYDEATAAPKPWHSELRRLQAARGRRVPVDQGLFPQTLVVLQTPKPSRWGWGSRSLVTLPDSSLLVWPMGPGEEG